MTSTPGLTAGLSQSKKFYLAFLCWALCLAGIVLAPWPQARASETRTELENIDVIFKDYERPGARSLVTAYSKAHPNDPDVLCMEARYRLILNKPAEAEQIYRRAIALSPNHVRAIGGLSFCQIERHDYKNAYENAAKAWALYEIDPIYTLPDPALIKNLQRLCVMNGRTKEAAVLQHQLKQFEYAKLARDYREQGVLEKALSVLDPLLTNDPKLAYAHLLRGVIYSNRSEYLKAIKDFDAVIAAQPNVANSYYFRGDCYSELGNKAKALESWRQILKLHPTAFPNLVAFCYTAMSGRFREHFDPNDETPVNRADIYYLCAVAESDLHHFEQAAKDYGQCIALDHGEYKAYFERAKINEHLQNEGLAMADLDQAIKINADYIEALLERAKIYEKKHDNARALADYSRVIAVNPGDFGSYILRADLAMRIKSYTQALADYSQAVKLSPSDDDPLMGRAKVYTALGRYDDALADYKKAMRLNPQDKAVVLDAIARVEKLKKSPTLSVR